MVSYSPELRIRLHGQSVADVTDGQVTVNRQAFRKLPLTVARRAIMAWGTTASGRPWRGTADAVEDARKIISSESTTGETHLADRLRVRLEYDTATIEQIDKIEPTDDETIAITVPGRGDVPWADLGIAVRTVKRDTVTGDIRHACGPDIQYLDADKVSGDLYVRQRRQGDSFRPIGLGGATKISDFLINKKVPVRLRDSIPILCCETGIMWVVGHAVDERYAVGDRTTELIEVTARPL